MSSPAAPRSGSGSRSGVSIARVVSRSRRYDPTDAKRKKFYAANKQYRTYQRLIRREGLATADTPSPPPPHPQQLPSTQNDDPTIPNISTDADTTGDIESADVLPGIGRTRRQQAKREARVRAHQDAEDEQRRRAESRESQRAARATRAKRFTAKTRRGQPIMANLVSDLIDKLSAQKARQCTL